MWTSRSSFGSGRTTTRCSPTAASGTAPAARTTTSRRGTCGSSGWTFTRPSGPRRTVRWLSRGSELCRARAQAGGRRGWQGRQAWQGRPSWPSGPSGPSRPSRQGRQRRAGFAGLSGETRLGRLAARLADFVFRDVLPYGPYDDRMAWGSWPRWPGILAIAHPLPRGTPPVPGREGVKSASRKTGAS